MLAPRRTMLGRDLPARRRLRSSVATPLTATPSSPSFADHSPRPCSSTFGLKTFLRPFSCHCSLVPGPHARGICSFSRQAPLSPPPPTSPPGSIDQSQHSVKITKMAKLKLTSWLGSSHSPGTDAEKKKEKRRPYVPSPFGRRGSETNGVSNQAPVANLVTVEPPSRMVALAQKITKDTEKLESYLKANNLPALSFDVDVPADFAKLPEDVARSRQDIIFASRELSLLAHGPRESLRWGVWEFLDVLALQIINHYGIGVSIYTRYMPPKY